MGPAPNLLAIVLTFVSLSLCKPTDSAAAFATGKVPNKVGFSLELSLRNPNLTAMEVVRRSSSSIASPNGIGIRPFLHNIDGYYVLKTEIGTNPTRAFELLFDTGSTFIWTQCKQCTQCFEQNHPSYDPVLSRTCDNMSYRSYFCRSPLTAGPNGECLFDEIYGNGRFIGGYMVRERFGMSGRTLDPPILTMDGVVVGCSLRGSQPMFNSPDIDGIMGMDRGSQSFIRQLRDFYSINIFSYCLVQLYTKAYSYFRVGDDVVVPYDLKNIPIMPYGDAYYVPLADVTVGDKRLYLPKGAVGDCIMDTGTTLTRMMTKAYNIIKQELVDYFNRFPELKQISGQRYRLDLCYQKPMGFNNFPKMDLHFVHYEGETVMHLDQALHMFVQDHNAFCLAMVPNPDRTVIGSIAMQNFLFVYDLRSSRIYFKPQNCEGK